MFCFTANFDDFPLPHDAGANMGANFGIAGLDWQQRINWDRMRKYRLERARERMKAHGLGAMICMYDENVRYLTGTLTPGWNRLKPGLRYAMLCGDDPPVLFEQGDLGFQIERHSPWIPKENVKWSYAWIKGAAGAASRQQVGKFTKAALEQMKKSGVAGMKLGVDFIDINMIQAFKDAKIDWVDGMTPDDGSARRQERRRAGMPAHRRRHRRRRALGNDEVPAARRHREPGDRAHHAVPLQHSRHGRRRGRDRLVRAEHLAQLAQLLGPHHPARRHRVHGSRRAHVERLQVVLLPDLLRRQGTDQEQKDVYATALKWLYDSIGAVKAGTTTREIASKWPSAKEAYGYEEEDQAAANLWGHGLGLAQYDPPVISRIWSLDHPIEIKAGMVFALETQHGKMFRWGVRIEEMLIVHEDSVEIISNFPVKQITVVDPIPGYGDHVK